MTRKEIIVKLEEIKRIIVEEIGGDEITDYTREHAYFSIDGAIETLEEND